MHVDVHKLHMSTHARVHTHVFIVCTSVLYSVHMNVFHVII